jgi:AcrR family transcriptional regulator
MNQPAQSTPAHDRPTRQEDRLLAAVASKPHEQAAGLLAPHSPIGCVVTPSTWTQRLVSPGVDQAILAATLRLLGEVGHAQLTMEQVAARAGVGKASLYLRWPSKDALIEYAIRQHGPIVAEVPDTGCLAEDMRHLLHALVRRRDPASTALPAIAGEAVRNPQLRDVFRRAITGAVPAAVRTIVQRAID